MANFLFVGVSTGQSFSQLVFPRWMEILGRTDVVLEGMDLPLAAPPPRYRAVVERIRQEPETLGALVTSHKLDLMAAAGDLFSESGPDAERCGEISSISKRDGHLIGRATDPTAGGCALRDLISDDYFGHTGGHLLCLGAGGAGTALALYLSQRPRAADRPERFIVVDIEEDRLAHLGRVLGGPATSMAVTYHHSPDVATVDQLVSSLPAGSVVINATGMGKDRPGSPLSDHARFPQDGIAWELNYRGERLFLQQARAQEDQRHLTVADGWHYFIHGWLQVIQHVLDVEINDVLFQHCARVAQEVRSGQS